MIPPHSESVRSKLGIVRLSRPLSLETGAILASNATGRAPGDAAPIDARNLNMGKDNLDDP